MNLYDVIETLSNSQIMIMDGGIDFDDGGIPSGDGEGPHVLWEEIPKVITALRRAYNARPSQSEADGVVASVLLQSAVAEAPGDFG
jgi:hypothetical protein